MKAVEMQQPGPMFPVMSSFPSTSITTEQIQKYLDENKTLILAILENQNLGKLAECARYQAQLQNNLMYLAAIADAQPQAPQASPHPALQQGYFMHHPPPAAAMAQLPRAQFKPSHPMQDPPPLLPPQSAQGQMALWPSGASNPPPSGTPGGQQVPQ